MNRASADKKEVREEEKKQEGTKGGKVGWRDIFLKGVSGG